MAELLHDRRAPLAGAQVDQVGGSIYAHWLVWQATGDGTVSWNSNLQWSQAAYVLLVESHRRGEPYGLAPGE